MSFLDRFQNKIATVTAHGHLKKADGSEEIRVGPPKRKAKAPTSSAESSSYANPPLPGKQHLGERTNNSSASTNVGKAAKGAPVPPIALPSGKQQQQLNPVASNHGKQSAPLPPQQQQHRSPDASPRNKTGRDSNGYDNNHSHRENYHQHGHYDANNIPGRLKDDYYDEPQYTNRSHGVSKSPSPTNERYARKDDNRSRNPPPLEQQEFQQQQQQPQQQQQRNHSLEPPQKELRSPKEINESRVQTDHDQLAFSRKARPVQYEPCKLSQYKKEKPAEYYELGKLQPDLNSDDLVQKRANAERIKAFSKNLRVINKSTQPKKEGNSNNDSPPATKKTGSSTRTKALEFAKRITKPKHSSRSTEESANIVGGGALSSTSSNSNIQSIATLSRPINSVLDDDSEDDQVSSELHQLQLRHQASRAQVEALIKKG
ncbi:hypothetical protein Gpo141_00008443 [Globisporangium polare]